MTKTKKQKIFLLTLTAFMCLIAFLFSSVGYTPKVFADGGEETQTQTEGETAYLDGLGEGINVLTASALNEFKSSYRVLRVDAIQSLPKSKYSLGTSEQSGMITTSASELLSNYETSFDFSVGVDSFLPKLVGSYTNTNSNTTTNYQYKFYYTSYKNLYNFRYEFQSYGVPNTYTQAFSPEFSADIYALKNGTSTLTYQEFFERYGTHIIGSAIYGGKLFTTYGVYSNEMILEQVVDNTLSAELQTPVPNTDILVNILGKYNDKYYSNYTESDLTAFWNIECIGGLPYDFETFEGLRQNYQTWLNSFIGSTVQETQEKVNAYSKLVDFTSDGLVPLWKILPCGYTEVAVAMEEAFLQLSETQKQTFEEDFSSVEVGEFTSGSGTSSQPYIITLPEQLRHIENHMSAYYRLGNDIDLSKFNNWRPIGGYHANNPFTGSLDGRDYKISNLKRMTTIPIGSDSKAYYGFFGWISNGGLIKRITFQNVSINITSPTTTNSSERIFMGVAVGKMDGYQIQYVTVEGTVSNSIHTTGVIFVGGVVGLVKNARVYACVNNANITGGRYSGVVGGIAGYGYNAQFIACKNYGIITARGANWGGCAYAGGILGEKYDNAELDCVFLNCPNNGSLVISCYDDGNWFFDDGISDECASTTNNLY